MVVLSLLLLLLLLLLLPPCWLFLLGVAVCRFSPLHQCFSCYLFDASSLMSCSYGSRTTTGATSSVDAVAVAVAVVVAVVAVVVVAVVVAVAVCCCYCSITFTTILMLQYDRHRLCSHH